MRAAGRARRILGAATEPHAVRRLLAVLGPGAEPPPALSSPGRLRTAPQRCYGPRLPADPEERSHF